MRYVLQRGCKIFFWIDRNFQPCLLPRFPENFQFLMVACCSKIHQSFLKCKNFQFLMVSHCSKMERTVWKRANFQFLMVSYCSKMSQIFWKPKNFQFLTSPNPSKIKLISWKLQILSFFLAKISLKSWKLHFFSGSSFLDVLRFLGYQLSSTFVSGFYSSPWPVSIRL